MKEMTWPRSEQRRPTGAATCYLAAVPSYFGGVMAFGWASDDPGHRTVAVQELARRYGAAGLMTDHYTPEVHKAAFALPSHIARIIE